MPRILILPALAMFACAGPQSALAGEPTQIGASCQASDPIVTGTPGLTYTTCGVADDPRFSFQSEGPGTQYGLKFTAPPTHCSAVNYQVYATYDLNHLLGRTQNFLEPGQSEIVPVGNDYARGTQVVAIRVLGKVGGCNQGRMSGWSGLVELVIIP
jgi:hypothetical protein